MYTISISQEIKEACPVFAGAAVYAKVRNTTYSEGLWREINAFTEQLTSTTQMEDIKRQPVRPRHHRQLPRSAGDGTGGRGRHLHR